MTNVLRYLLATELCNRMDAINESSLQQYMLVNVQYLFLRRRELVAKEVCKLDKYQRTVGNIQHCTFFLYMCCLVTKKVSFL